MAGPSRGDTWGGSDGAAPEGALDRHGLALGVATGDAQARLGRAEAGQVDLDQESLAAALDRHGPTAERRGRASQAGDPDLELRPPGAPGDGGRLRAGRGRVTRERRLGRDLL